MKVQHPTKLRLFFLIGISLLSFSPIRVLASACLSLLNSTEITYEITTLFLAPIDPEVETIPGFKKHLRSYGFDPQSGANWATSTRILDPNEVLPPKQYSYLFHRQPEEEKREAISKGLNMAYETYQRAKTADPETVQMLHQKELDLPDYRKTYFIVKEEPSGRILGIVRLFSGADAVNYYMALDKDQFAFSDPASHQKLPLEAFHPGVLEGSSGINFELGVLASSGDLKRVTPLLYGAVADYIAHYYGIYRVNTIWARIYEREIPIHVERHGWEIAETPESLGQLPGEKPEYIIRYSAYDFVWRFIFGEDTRRSKDENSSF